MNSSQIFNFQSEILFIKHTSYKNFYGLNSEDKDIIKIENIQDKENCLIITVNNVFNNELKAWLIKDNNNIYFKIINSNYKNIIPILDKYYKNIMKSKNILL